MSTKKPKNNLSEKFGTVLSKSYSYLSVAYCMPCKHERHLASRIFSISVFHMPLNI